MVGLALGCQIARLHQVGPQELLLPRPAQELPDQPVRPAAVRRRARSRSPTKTARRKTIRIRRAHLEEDAGKILHEAPGGHPIDHSIVDLNRAGTPLLEIVTEPDLTSAEAGRHASARSCRGSCGSSASREGQMQMGHMRFEPNINVHITDSDGSVHKTPIAEVKNLNSFRVLERATAYEIQRQVDAVGARPARWASKSTCGWDEATRADVPPAREGRGPRLPLLPRPRPGAGRGRRRVAGRAEIASRRTAGRPPAALHRSARACRPPTRRCSPAIAPPAIASKRPCQPRGGQARGSQSASSSHVPADSVNERPCALDRPGHPPRARRRDRQAHRRQQARPQQRRCRSSTS